MKIIVDERERDLFAVLNGLPETPHIQITKQVLPLGDISVETDSGQKLLLIERKTCADLLASIKDGRYDEQSYRLIHSAEYPVRHNIVYLVEGIFSKYVAKDRKLMYSTMTSLNYFKGFSLWRASSVEETADILVAAADKIHRDLKKGKTAAYTSNIVVNQSHTEEPNNVVVNNDEPSSTVVAADYCSVVKKVKKENITAENIGEIVLCQIPTVSSVSAIAIMKQFGTFPALMTAIQQNPAVLDNITYEASNGKKRKISKTSIKLIKEYLVG
jgi:ERCC4-type nuclease